MLGVENPAHYIKFEEQVHLDHTSFIDGFIPAPNVFLESCSKPICSVPQMRSGGKPVEGGRKAHQENDRVVMKAYGFDVKTMTESTCVAELMKMYQELTKE